MKNPSKHIVGGFLFLLSTIAIGVIGYMVIEGWRFLDALYMTMITITTTGFHEVHPLSDEAKWFTVILIIMGISSIAYISGRTIQIIVESNIFRRRRMNKKINELENHFLVCGYGKIGEYICKELVENAANFIVIEKDPVEVERLRQTGYLYSVGNPSDDDILIQAGIQRAKGFIAAMPNDAENVFATLSAKVINPKIFIVAMAVEDDTESKLLKAGANRVVKPFETSGTRMAEIILRPGVIEFIDIVARDKSVDLNIEEVYVRERSPLVNKSLADSHIRQELNIMVVSVIKSDGRLIYNPQSPTTIEAGDKLIVLGEGLNLIKLNKLCAGE
jgi:voltage-gated potassium channel